MIKKLIRKSKLNISSMIRHGSVATITIFLVGILFGAKNVMLVFPIALTSIVMGRQNFQVKTISKALRIIVLDITIVLIAHLSSLNLYLGIPINFISIFLIMYTITSPYDLTFYKPFLMLFIFTQYASVPTSQLYLRVLAVILGICIVVLASIIKKVNEKSILGNSIISGLKDINLQLNNILNGVYDKNLQEKCSLTMRDLTYKIYVTRYKGYLTTYLGKIQFKLFISIEYLNLSLLKVEEMLVKGQIGRRDILEVKSIIEGLLEYGRGMAYLPSIDRKLKTYSTLNLKKGDGEKDCVEIGFNKLFNVLENILEGIDELNNLDYKELNKIYHKWERTDLDKPRVMFKTYFEFNNVRFTFALRMAITMTMALFLGESLGYYKVIWAIITIMSIMQPYYEDTILKAKDRVLGNILAILITGIIVNIADSYWVTTGILIVSLYLLYGFKEYYKISLFAGMASICIASLTENINTLIFYRIIYVVIGVIAVMVINKFLFPYKIEEGINVLENKILSLKNKVIKASKEIDKNNFNEHEIRDLVIHITLLSQKLHLRNLQYNSSEVEKFIYENNRDVIEVAYNTLAYCEFIRKENFS